MSFVYLADDVLTKERVAIKILSPALSQDRTAMARLRREAELGGKLEHPNVCHIIRLGETQQRARVRGDAVRGGRAAVRS